MPVAERFVNGVWNDREGGGGGLIGEEEEFGHANYMANSGGWQPGLGAY